MHKNQCSHLLSYPYDPKILWKYFERSSNPPCVFSKSFNFLAEIIQKSLNFNTNDLYATVAKIVDISFQNFYLHTALGDPSLINFPYKITSNIPNSLSEFNLLYNKDIDNYNEKTLSTVTTYRINNQYITLTVSNKNHSILAFGLTQPFATFYNFTQIDSNPDSSIYFFQNINQAFAFENILTKYQLKPSHFIITGHNSDNIEILDWSLLSHKKLIFFCETKKKAYEEINYYKYYFDTYSINYKIFPYPLLFKELGYDSNKEYDDTKLSYDESNLLKKALYIDTDFKRIFERINNETLSWKEFVHWGYEINLFSKNQVEENFFTYTSLPDTNSKEFETDIHNISLDSLFINNGITLLHAPTETGKSIFALSIAKALLNSNQFLFFKPSQKQPKILILDGETPPNVFAMRLNQLDININDENLHLISILQEKTGNHNTLWSNLDLSSNECKDYLATFIKIHNINFVIFDNISCLVPQNISTEKLPQEFFNWLHKLSDKCSVLLIHHTKEDGTKVKGSQLWPSRSPNEIQLIKY